MRNNIIIYNLLLVMMSHTVLTCRLEIESFRPISTLTETVHEGVVEVLSDLQTPNNVNVEYLMQRVEELNSEVNIHRGNDPIRSVDKEYLQDMLDQIDRLIAELENPNAVKKVEGLRESCSQLRNNLN